MIASRCGEMKNVIIPQTSEYIMPAADEMVNGGHWNLKCVIALENVFDVEELQVQYPDALILKVNDARCGCYPADGMGYGGQIPLDANILNEFSSCERIVLKMMDRIAPVWEFGYEHRIRHYHRLLSYWLAFVKNNNIDLAVFQTTPHVIYDYIIYSVCKYYGVRCLMLEKTPFQDLMYWYDDIELGFVKLKSMYRESILLNQHFSSEINLSPVAKRYLGLLSSDVYSNSKPVHFVETEKNINRRKLRNIIPRFFRSVAYWKDIIVNGRGRNHHCISLNRVLPEAYKNISMFWIFVYRIKVLMYQNKIRSYYDKLSLQSSVDLNCDYIYFPLQCQPEKSTSPLAGDYVYQLLIIRLLDSTMPKGWKIYVKEHASQLTGVKQSEMSRTKMFYDDISSLSSVEIVRTNVDSFQLIDSSRLVAVSTGSTGFESICRGKNVLLFGETWYSACEGVYKITDKDDLVCFFNTETNIPDMSRIKLYVSLLEKIGFSGFNHPSYEKNSNLTRNDVTSNFLSYFMSI